MKNETLIDILRKASKNKKPKPYSDSKVLDTIKNLRPHSLPSFILHFALLGGVIQHYLRNNEEFNIFLFIHIFFAFIFSINIWVLVNTLNSEPQKKEIDDWYWKKGKKVLFLQTTLYLEAAFLLPLHYPFEQVFNSLLYLSAISFICYIIIIFTLCSKTELILSGFWTKTGDITKHISLMSFYIWYLTTIQNDNISIAQFLIITLGGILIIKTSVSLFKRMIFTNILTDTQLAVMQILKPKNLFLALRKKEEEIDDKIVALSINRYLEINKHYGVQRALREELVRDYTTKSKTWLFSLFGWLFSLIIIIIDPLGDAIIQEILYQNYLREKFCIWFELLCD